MSQTVIKKNDVGIFRERVEKKEAFFSKVKFKSWFNVIGIFGLSGLIFLASFLI